MGAMAWPMAVALLRRAQALRADNTAGRREKELRHICERENEAFLKAPKHIITIIYMYIIRRVTIYIIVII